MKTSENNIGINIRTIIDSQISLALSDGVNLEYYIDRNKVIDEMINIFEGLQPGDWLTTDNGTTFDLSFIPTKKVC